MDETQKAAKALAALAPAEMARALRLVALDYDSLADAAYDREEEGDRYYQKLIMSSNDLMRFADRIAYVWRGK